MIRRVLLVEDDPGDAFLVRELLAEVEPDLQLSVAATLTQALDPELLAATECILLDLNLPGAHGLEVLRAVLGVHPDAAVCVLTGTDDEHLGIAAVAAGAQDYLVKGTVDGPLLIRSIRYAVERQRAEASQLRLREEQLVAAEASRLERGLLPSPLLAGSAVRARMLYRSGRARSLLGGDFFDAVLGPTGVVHAIVGDVCGHGPDEAALGALLRVSWRALVLGGVEEEQLLPKLQQVFVTERHDSALFTTVCTIAIPREGDSRVRVAGHPPPIVVRPTLQEVAPPVGLPLGIRVDARWDPVPLRLDPGWALMLYTDGLVEGRGFDPDQPLWPEGLIELLKAEQGTDLDLLPGRLVERAQELNGGPLADDVAILVLSADSDPSDLTPAPSVSLSGTTDGWVTTSKGSER